MFQHQPVEEAPKLSGMRTFCLRCRLQRIHRQNRRAQATMLPLHTVITCYMMYYPCCVTSKRQASRFRCKLTPMRPALNPTPSMFTSLRVCCHRRDSHVWNMLIYARLQAQIPRNISTGDHRPG